MLKLIYQISTFLLIIILAMTSDKERKGGDTLTLLILSFTPALNTLIVLVTIYNTIKEE